MSLGRPPKTPGPGFEWPYLLGLVALCGVLFFWGLGERSLWETDEARYAEIAREMVQSGDWVTPRLNYVKYFEKPALPYWLIAASFELFGESAFSARLTPAVFGTLTVILVFLLGRRMWDARAGLLAGAGLATSLMFLALSRVLLVDMVLCFGVVLALHGAWALRQGREWGRYAFWGGCAVGLLTKGLLGPGLPIMVAAVFGVLAGEWAWLRNLARLRGPAFFLLLCAPWLILVSWANPEFLNYFFIEENFGRLLTKRHQRYQPAYFYLTLLPGALFPWVALLPWGLWKTWPGGAWRAVSQRPWLLAACWFLFLFLFLSASQSKMIHYTLPMLPPLALLLGKALCSMWYANWRDQPPAGVSWGIGALGGILVAAGVGLMAAPSLSEEVTHQQAGALLLIGPLGLAALGLAVFAARRLMLATWAAPLSVLLLLAGLAGVVTARLDDYRSVEGLVAPLRGQLTGDDRLVNYGDYYHGTVYYSGRRVAVVRNWGELEFGRARDPEAKKWFLPDDAEFVRLLQSPQVRVLAVAETQAYMKLKERMQGTPGLLLFEWSRVGDKSLFSNRPR